MNTTKRTGTLEPLRDATGRPYYAGKIRLADKSRTRVEIPEAKRYSETAARNYLAWAQEQEDATHAHYNAKISATTKRQATTPGAPGETCDAFFGRCNAYAKEQGQTNTDKRASTWGKWASDVMVRGGTVRFGDLPIAAVTRNDIEDLRDGLDAAVDAWKASGGRNGGKRGRAISGKTAMNGWTVITSSFKEAMSSKRRDLRVREDNPCVGVQPPGSRDSRKVRRKTFLYPREASALLACAEIPRDWREVYAVALYTYLRPGELRVLTWGDVDLDAMHMSITKAWDYSDEKIKPPKTSAGIRNVPIDASLLPLLERLKRDAGDDASALVVPRLSAFGEDHLAELFRRHLKLAGVKRAELHATTLTHVQGNSPGLMVTTVVCLTFSVGFSSTSTCVPIGSTTRTSGVSPSTRPPVLTRVHGYVSIVK